PGPGSQRVMCNVEPQRSAQRMLLIFRAEHALRNITAATRLCARIPRCPPLHAEVHDESQQRQRPDMRSSQPGMKIRKERHHIRSRLSCRPCCVTHNRKLELESVHASKL